MNNEILFSTAPFTKDEFGYLQNIIYTYDLISCVNFNNSYEKRNIINYLKLSFIENKKLHLYIDRNILSYVNDFYEQNNETIGNQKIALAHILIFSLVEVEVFDFLEGVYEYTNSASMDIEIIKTEWDNIFSLKKQPIDKIMSFLTKGAYYDANKYKKEFLKPDFNSYTDPEIEWSSIYLNLLKMKIIDLTYNNENKLLKYLDWVFYEYKFDSICIYFAFILFSENRFSGMLPPDLKKIKNIAWDLKLLSYWFKESYNSAKKFDKINVLISFDKKLNKFASILSDIVYLDLRNKDVCINYFKQICPNTAKNFINICEDYIKRKDEPKRKKRSFNNEEEKKNFITELETELLSTL